jgi:hypothetical protein
VVQVRLTKRGKGKEEIVVVAKTIRHSGFNVLPYTSVVSSNTKSKSNILIRNTIIVKKR